MLSEIEHFLKFLNRDSPYEGIKADEIWVDECLDLDFSKKK